MTAVGELLRALFDVEGSWTSGYWPDVVYAFDESQFKSGTWKNNSKLFILPAIPPQGGKKPRYNDGYRGEISRHYFILQRNDGDDDKLDTQYKDIATILKAGVCTGYDDNYIDENAEVEEHVTRRVAGVDGVAMTGVIVVEDRVA